MIKDLVVDSGRNLGFGITKELIDEDIVAATTFDSTSVTMDDTTVTFDESEEA